MRLFWSLSNKRLNIVTGGHAWSCYCDCIVRNELNGWRPNKNKIPKSELVYAISEDNLQTKLPVMPRPFPAGTWEIIGVEYRDDNYRAPLVIKTNAEQELDIWDTNDKWEYVKPTGKKIMDHHYYLHCSVSKTTQGCGNLHQDKLSLYRLATEILIEQKEGSKIILEVVA